MPREQHLENLGGRRGPCLAACRVPASLATSNGMHPCRQESTLACRSGAQDVADTESHDAPTETGRGTKRCPWCGQPCKRGARGLPGTWLRLTRDARAGGTGGSRLLLAARSSTATYYIGTGNDPLAGPASCTTPHGSLSKAPRWALVCSASLPETPCPATGVLSAQGPLPRGLLRDGAETFRRPCSLLPH